MITGTTPEIDGTSLQLSHKWISCFAYRIKAADRPCLSWVKCANTLTALLGWPGLLRAWEGICHGYQSSKTQKSRTTTEHLSHVTRILESLSPTFLLCQDQRVNSCSIWSLCLRVSNLCSNWNSEQVSRGWDEGKMREGVMQKVKEYQLNLA